MGLLRKLARRLLRPALAPPSAAERTLIEALRQKIRALPPTGTKAAGNDVESLWAGNRARLREELLSNDPRGFLDFPVIRESMFVDRPTYIGRELSALRGTTMWRKGWSRAIRESDCIPAPRYPRLLKSSGNLIHQAYHLHEFGRATGADPSAMDTILEFGGGYGAMCRLIRRLGFRGRYFIYDLPEFSALQEFYLRANDIPLSSSATSVSGTVCFSDPGELRQVASTFRLDLFIATWSLSETPFAFRQTLLDSLRPRHWLIGYQHEFESLDNAGFFADWTRSKTDYHWWNIPLDHMPGVNMHLFGTLARA